MQSEERVHLLLAAVRAHRRYRLNEVASSLRLAANVSQKTTSGYDRILILDRPRSCEDLVEVRNENLPLPYFRAHLAELAEKLGANKLAVTPRAESPWLCHSPKQPSRIGSCRMDGCARERYSTDSARPGLGPASVTAQLSMSGRKALQPGQSRNW